MQIFFGWLTILFGVVISQSAFASVVLWFNPQNRPSNRILAVLLLSIALWLIDTFLGVSGLYKQAPNLYFKPIYYSFAFGPLIYFYVKSLTNSTFSFKQKHLLHFAPVLLQALLYWFLTFQDYSFKRWYWLEVHQPFTYRIEFDGTFVSLAIYLGFSIRLLQKYRHWLNDSFSEFSRITLNWLRLLLILMLLLCVQWFVEVILREFYQSYYDYNFSVLILGILALLLAFGGIRQISLNEVTFTGTSESINVKKPTVDEAILQKITARMATKKDYLNPTLTLKGFAHELKIPSRTISEHINHGLGKSFVDFVNEYRVNEVKRRLNSSEIETYTILSIAFDSGFNSKATFNRTFKKFTGKSPREFTS